MFKRLVLWLARKCGAEVVEPISTVRLRGGNDAVLRGERWEMFYREEGGLLDMLEAERRDIFEAMGSLDPGDIQKVYWLAHADRIVRRLQGRIEAIVVSGKIEASNIARLDAERAFQRKRLDF